MKIIDTFPFSEPHEENLLWLKLNLGKEVVDKWVIVENNFTFQGEHKGYHAKEVLKKDKFKPFVDRIKIIEGSYNIRSKIRFDCIQDEEALAVESYTRELSREYILNNFSQNDILIISDVDEMPDFIDNNRRDILWKSFNSQELVIKIPRLRFWYDYDNIWYAKRATPAIKIQLLLQGKNSLAELRKENITSASRIFKDKPFVFEYSFCFDKEGIIRKYNTFGHTGFSIKAIERSLLCNHIALHNNIYGFSPYYWLETINLTKHNSPSFIRENMFGLKTNSISCNYRKNRKKYYPDIYPSKFPKSCIAMIKRSKTLRNLRDIVMF